VTDIISEAVLGSFWLMLPGQIVSLMFLLKLGSSPSLLSLWSTF